MVNAPFVTRLVGAMDRSGTDEWRMNSRTVHRGHRPKEKWMKLVKTSAIALALSAMLAAPVLAQGTSSDTQIRGSAQGRSNMPQGGATGSSDEEFNAQPGAAGEKAGVNAKTGTKGTVGAGSGAARGAGGAAADPMAGGKRY
jgi:hypothetical protein